jgi:hypothetical protein
MLCPCFGVTIRLRHLWDEDPSAPHDWSGWTLNVTAGSGAVVLSVDLNSDMVASHRLEPPQLKPSANPSELDLLRLLLLRRSREPDQAGWVRLRRKALPRRGAAARAK